MFKESSNIKILLKYHNYSPENNFFHSITNNDVIQTTSNSKNAINRNNRYSNNSIISSSNIIPAKINKDINKQENQDYEKYINHDYLIDFKNNHNYNNLENPFPPKMINIKMCIYLYLIEKRIFDITLDSIILFIKHHNKYQILNDDDNFYQKYKTKSNEIIDEKNSQNSNSFIIYYYINNDKINVIVDLYSKSVDRISIKLSKMCSLLMLKFIILSKLRENENNKNVSNSNKNNNNKQSSKTKLITMKELEKETKIYGNGIMKNDLSSYIVKNQTNRNFECNFTIFQIYNYYINMPNKEIDWEKDLNNINYDDNSSSSKEQGILNFIFMEKKDNKCKFGLDFRFTILQYFYPLSNEEIVEDNKLEVINYYNNDFYQIKSGINLYFKCLNANCKHNQILFVLNIGYGTFDIFNLIKHNTLCPSCNKKSFYYNNNIRYYAGKSVKNNLELKYIGMMNSKWSYKGYLEGIKMTLVDGKGLTVVNNLIYRTKEFNFLSQFKKLLIQADFYTSKNNYIKNSDNSLLSDFSEIKEDIKIDDKNTNIEKNIEKNKILKKEEDEPNQIKITDIQIKQLNKRNSKKSENFIKFKTEKQTTQPEDADLENNTFITLKSKQILYKKNSTIKQTNVGNKRYSHNIENFENNNTNIDFNIIIDKTKTNCCETCFEYDQLSQVCSIF